MTFLRSHFSIVLALIVALLMVGSAFFISPQTQKIAHAPRASADPVTNAMLLELAMKDSDGDGIPDWEEILLGTDPFNPDSNGNVIPDGEERDQLLALKKGDISKNSSLPIEETWSLTDRIARTFFRDYMAALQYGPVSTQTQTALVSKTVEDVTKEIYGRTPHFSRNDMKVQENDDVTQYLANLESSLLKSGINDVPKKNELELIQEAISEGSSAPLIEARGIGETYHNMAKAIADTPALPGKTQLHADHANALYNVGDAIILMTNPFADPIEALVGLSMYRLAIADMVTTFIHITREAELRAYTPQKGEPGAFYFSVALTRP